MSNLAQDIVARLSPGKQALLLQHLNAKRDARTRIPPRESASDSFPLSFAQQRLWFLDQLEPGGNAYNIPAALRLHGSLSLKALHTGFQQLVKRHESLRTIFVSRQGTPAQLIAPDCTVSLPVIDLSRLDAAQQAWSVQTLFQQEAQRPFDLERGPLLRLHLVRVQADEQILLVCQHHIISDAWSAGILLKELDEFYCAALEERAPSLVPLPVQYADFALWQRCWLAETRVQEQLSYWQTQLADAPQVLTLPWDHPRPAVQSYGGAQQRVLVPIRLQRALEDLSRREGVTLFMTMLASFQVLLQRYSGQDDLVVGTSVANRPWKELEGLIGFFVNTLALRVRVQSDRSFRVLLEQVREVALGAYAHQDLPFEQLMSALTMERSLSYAPVFQVFFAFLNMEQAQMKLGGLGVELLEMEQQSSKFDLAMELQESGQGLQARVEYNTDLFEATTIQRLLEHWLTVLEGIVAQPEQPLYRLSLLSPVQKEQVLIDWNDTTTDLQNVQGLHQIFERQVRHNPTAIALKTTTVSLTYQEVDWRANQLAHALSRLGMSAGAHVGVCMPGVPEAIIGLLGILKAGGVYVPLDPRYPQERLAFMLEDAQIAILLTQESVRHVLPMHTLPVIVLDAVWFQESTEFLDPPVQKTTPDQLAYMIYTSGSTGRPKGVLVSHQGLQNLIDVQTRNFELRAEDHILQFASLSFDASIWEVCMSLGVGATLCLGAEGIVLAGPALQETIEQLEISVVTLPPSILESLLPQRMPSLRTIIVAGEACPPELAKRWAVGRRFVNAYGPTETTVCASMEQYRKETALSIGRPIANTQIYILDAFLQPMPVGVSGELYIGGMSLAYGYFKRPELTAERFVPNPFALQGGARVYKTGDRGRYRADGSIEFLGRIDNQVKIRGHRIEVGEIEAVLLHNLTVQECVVVVNGTTIEDRRLIAYIVMREGAVFASEEIREYLHQRLPDYMLPASILSLERMPLTSNGKIDRKGLPDPESKRQQAQAMLVQPSTASECTIAAIWQEILHVEKISCHENFFELGAHSLHVVQIIQRLQEHFQREIALTDLFQYPTISVFARYLDQADVPAVPATVQMHQEEALQAGKDRLKKMRLRQERKK